MTDVDTKLLDHKKGSEKSSKCRRNGPSWSVDWFKWTARMASCFTLKRFPDDCAEMRAGREMGPLTNPFSESFALMLTGSPDTNPLPFPLSSLSSLRFRAEQ